MSDEESKLSDTLF
jgi:hypothetical protein